MATLKSTQRSQTETIPTNNHAQPPQRSQTEKPLPNHYAEDPSVQPNGDAITKQLR